MATKSAEASHAIQLATGVARTIFPCSVQCILSSRNIVRAVGGGRTVCTRYVFCARLYSSEGRAGAESFGNHCLCLYRIVLHDSFFLSSVAVLPPLVVAIPIIQEGPRDCCGVVYCWRFGVFVPLECLFAWLVRPGDVVGTWWFVREERAI